MAYLYNIPNNTTNLDQILVQTVSTVPALTPMILVFVFFVVMLGGIARQKAKNLTADYAMWAVVGSLSTFFVAIIMTLTTGLISLDWYVIVVVLGIFSFVWFFLSKKGGEI